MSDDDTGNLGTLECIVLSQKTVLKKFRALDVLATLIGAHAFDEASIEALLQRTRNFVFGGTTREQAVETWRQLSERLPGMNEEGFDKLSREIMEELREVKPQLTQMLRNVQESTAKAASILALSSEDGSHAINKLIDIRVR